jgi:hypothetical protein
MLISYLDAQRNHVLGILDGLSDKNLRRAVLPSGWSCLGLVRHLTLDVERFWFQAVVAGNPSDKDKSTEGDESTWRIAEEVPARVVFDSYRREAKRANAIIRSTSLDAPPAWWPQHVWPDWRHKSLRQTILHVMTETACHAGHLDAARELIDGRQYMAFD